MKNKNRTFFQLFSFLIFTVISAAFTIAFKYYITFSEETAGSYQVITTFGDSIKIFLIKVLSVAASLLAFITFMIKSRKKYSNKAFFPACISIFGVIWMILPFLSAYTISRFTGLLIIQTVSSIAIIANAVFFVVSMLFAVISLIDLIHCIMTVSELNERADYFATSLCGIPFGCCAAIFLTPVLQSLLGLSSAYFLLGLIAFLTGLSVIIRNYILKRRNS